MSWSATKHVSKWTCSITSHGTTDAFRQHVKSQHHAIHTIVAVFCILLCLVCLQAASCHLCRTCCCAQQSYLLFCSAVPPAVLLSIRPSAIAGFSGMPAPPVRIPSKPPSIQQAPTGGAPMGTPPSARGIAAQLPFVDGGPEGRLSNFFCPSSSLLHAGTACVVASEQGELFVCCTTAACSQAASATFAPPCNTWPS